MNRADQSAFPTAILNGYEPEPGLTKREYFAAAALQGLLADPTPLADGFEYEDLAVEAADALITALDAQPTEAAQLRAALEAILERIPDEPGELHPLHKVWKIATEALEGVA